jgi:glycosyltransferase involved in cell wall biosynthesis
MVKRMRILLATYWMIPHLGGVWAYMQELQKKLELLGHEVDLMGNTADCKGFHVVNRNQVIQKKELVPFIIARLNSLVFPHLHAAPEQLASEIDRYCMELAAAYFGLDQYDLIHTQDVISTLAISRVKPAQIPLLASIHGSFARESLMIAQTYNPTLREEDFNKTLSSKYNNALEREGADAADLILSANHWLKNLLVNKYFVPEEKVMVFPYGLDVASFLKKVDNCDSPITPPPNKKVILCTARLTFIKGIHYLLSALAQLKKERTDWVCWIAGEGEMREELIRQSINLGLEHEVVFLGYRRDVPCLLKRSDIFVLPSIQDNQPFSVIEAQAAGKPVLVSDAGGLPEMVLHGKTGFISPVGRSDVISHHLKLLLENDEYRKQLGYNAETWAIENWSLDTMLKRLMSVYGSLLKSKRK